MNNKVELFKIVNTGEETEVKIWDGIEVFIHTFIPVMFYSVINLFIEKMFRCKWSEFVPLVTYMLLLLSISIFIMRYRKKCKGKLKLSEVEMVEIVKIVLVVNSSYFLCAGIHDEGELAVSLTVTNIALYLGFAISLEDLLKVQTWKDVVHCFLNVLPKKKYVWLMLISCGLFGILGGYSEEQVIYIGMFIILGLVFLLIILLYVWRGYEIDSRCKELVAIYGEKRILFLHTGTNLAILEKIKKEIEFFEEVDSLKNKYDVVIVIDTSYKMDKKVEILDSIKKVLKTGGLILDPFIGKHEKRSKFRAWVGAPKCWKEYNSIEKYIEMYYFSSVK